MTDIRQAVKTQAALLLGATLSVKAGTVSATRPDMNAVKVMLQPEGIETGWLPVGTILAGNGWGVVAKPPVDTQVLVVYQENDRNNGVVICSLFSVIDQPPSTSIKDGELWLQHQTGSILKFTADGNVTLNAQAKMMLQATEFDFTGTVKVTGDVTATGTVTGQTDVKAGSEPVSVVNHKHTLVQPGIGVSGPPQ